MNEILIAGSKKGGGEYIAPPSPTTCLFLASASNGMNPDLSGNKSQTDAFGVTKTTLGGHDVVKSNNGYITYNYGLNLSPFRRGARIDAMVYIDRANDVYPNQIHPTLIGFMIQNTGTNYWSFGVKLVLDQLRVCFYGWNGQANPMSGTENITTGWHLISYFMGTDGVHLSLDGKEVFFQAVSDAQLAAFVNSQGGVSAAPLTMFRNANTPTNTNTAWVAIK